MSDDAVMPPSPGQQSPGQQSLGEQSPGPTRIADPRLRHEAQRAAIWIGMAVLAGVIVYFSQPLMVIFGGIVFAAMLDGGARLLGRVLPVGRGVRITIVMVLALLFIGWTAYFAGNQIAAQAALFPALVETQIQRAAGWLQAHGFEIEVPSFSAIAQQLASGAGQVGRALGGLLGGLTTAFLIVVLGIYIALEPRLYERGIEWMLPVKERPYLAETVRRMSHALRRLLAGRLLGMAIEGVATWLALWAYGVPMAALLGLLTGVLAFLPNIGAPISGALIVLVGFSGGVDMGLFCIGVYLVVQIVDSNIIMPMVAKKTVDLAPALVLGAQLVMGVMFGILGLALADPIVAMIKILLERRSERSQGELAEPSQSKLAEPSQGHSSESLA